MKIDWKSLIDDSGKAVIPQNVSEIEYHAFRGCTNLVSVEIPESVTFIGNGAFRECTNLVKIDIPDNVYIEGCAFLGCTGLSSILLPKGLRIIEHSTFSGCSSLTSLLIPESVREIQHNAFAECTGLSTMVIPDNVSLIMGGAFDGCTGLKSITISKNIKSLNGAFSGCTSLERITVSVGNAFMKSQDDCVLSIDGTTLLMGCKNSIIPHSIKRIGADAFDCGSSLTSIEIPDSIEEIEFRAFEGCTGLTSLVIPQNTAKIGRYAFYGCSGLSSIEIPAGVTEISEGLFFHCSSLKDVALPVSVKKIGAFAFEGCIELSSLFIPEGVNQIGDFAFKDCTGLTSIKIPEGASLGRNVFQGCNESIDNQYTKQERALGAGKEVVTIYDLEQLIKEDITFKIKLYYRKGTGDAVFKAVYTEANHYSEKFSLSDFQRIYLSGKDNHIYVSDLCIIGQESLPIKNLSVNDFVELTKGKQFKVAVTDNLYRVFNDDEIIDLRCIFFNNDEDVANYIINSLQQGDYEEASRLSQPARMYSLIEV